MPARILLALLAVCICGCSGDASLDQAEAQLSISSFSEGNPLVTVERKDFRSAGKFITPDAQVASQWQTNYSICSKALVEAAEMERLDSLSLAQILEKLRSAPENKGLAILPVAALATKSGDEQVWRVALRWEIAGRDRAKLAHIREFTITRKTLKQVKFSTCS